MKVNRRTVAPLVPPLLVMAAVASLLLFFYSDTAYDYQPRLLRLTPDQTHRLQNTPSNPLRGAPAADKQSSDVIAASSVRFKRRDVILISLGRSGSSYTADVVSHAPGVYYVFEPLKMAEELFWQRRAQNTSSDEVEDTVVEMWRNQTRNILQHFLSCDFNNLDLSLLDVHFLSKTTRSGALARCVRTHRKPRDVTSCVRDAEDVCRRTRSRLLKVIRPRLRDLVPLLDINPDLLVILLVRDPRASMWSMVNVFNHTRPSGYSQLFRTMCGRLDDDLTSVVESQSRFPGRIKMLRYETIAKEPVRIAKLLYRYLGLQWSSHAENQIRRQTGFRQRYASRRRHAMLSSPYSVMRNDSAEASRAWRRSVTWPFVQAVQLQCFEVMRRLGYSLFRLEQDLKDLAVTSYVREDLAVDERLVLQ